VNVKTETVQFMADSKLLDKIFQSVWGRLFIVALQTTLSSLVLFSIFLFRQSGDLTLLKYAIVLVVGFIAGFSARRFLKTQTQTLKLLVAILSAALSLTILYTLSGGFLGLNLFFRLNKAPDWTGLIQFGLAAFGAWLVVTAFRTPLTAPAPLPRTSTPPKSRPAIKRWPSKITFPSGKKIIQKFSRVAVGNKEPLSVGKPVSKKAAPSKAKPKSPGKASSAHKLSVAAPTTKINKPTGKKKRRVKKRSQKEIKFVGIEEHSCPYCLDPVQPHDPRGVKICPICKTHHHADCWGITGACQIPHAHD